MVNLNGKTRVYGIIGDPITHSLSPSFQNYFLSSADLNASYVPFSVKPENLSLALKGLHASGVQGLNITVPHKEAAMSKVKADSDAQIIGAVNTAKSTPSGWVATNTDWQGFAAVLQGLQANVSEAPILLFGAGGTARAVCHALQHEGAKIIKICNRSKGRAEQLASDFKTSYPDVEIEILPWDSDIVAGQTKASEIIINTSIIGLNDSDTFPFELIGNGFAIDAVYKQSGRTAFGLAAEKGGFIAFDGLPMLIAQGIASFAFWHQDALNKNKFDLPDKLESLHWVEKKLARQPLSLPGWRT